MIQKHLILIWIILALVSCSEPKYNKLTQEVTRQDIIEYNRKSVRIEADQIDKFIQRRGWNMTETGTGLRYMIYDSSGKNESKPKENQTVVVNYKVSLINGQEIYVSNPEKPATFVVGHDDVESGLQEGIKFLTPGDKAVFIIPSHLAHGYTGDFDKIPHNATVIFDIELLEIK